MNWWENPDAFADRALPTRSFFFTAPQRRLRSPRRPAAVAVATLVLGALAALVHAFSTTGVPRFEIVSYSEHALSAGEEAAAIAYIQIKHSNGRTRWGAGVDTNIELASVRAVLSALNRS